RGVPPATVVKDFDVVEDFAAGLGARAPSGLVDQFNLECGEEALGHCVVPAIGSAAHAAQQRMPREQLLVFAACVYCHDRNGEAVRPAAAAPPMPYLVRRA